MANKKNGLIQKIEIEIEIENQKIKEQEAINSNNEIIETPVDIEKNTSFVQDSSDEELNSAPQETNTEKKHKKSFVQPFSDTDLNLIPQKTNTEKRYNEYDKQLLQLDLNKKASKTRSIIPKVIMGVCAAFLATVAAAAYFLVKQTGFQLQLWFLKDFGSQALIGAASVGFLTSGIKVVHDYVSDRKDSIDIVKKENLINSSELDKNVDCGNTNILSSLNIKKEDLIKIKSQNKNTDVNSDINNERVSNQRNKDTEKTDVLRRDHTSSNKLQ